MQSDYLYYLSIQIQHLLKLNQTNQDTAQQKTEFKYNIC